MSQRGRVALVTGGNRGIGFEICRQLAQLGMRVILTARDEARGREAAERIAQGGGDVRFRQLDTTRSEDVRDVVSSVARESGGRLDVLVNNAAVLLDREVPGLEVATDTIRATMETNVYGPLELCRAVMPIMRAAGYGRIVNMSSDMGSLSGMGGGYLAYRMSKAALNVVTRVISDETRGSGIIINSMHPGWVKTEMGGPGAQRSAEQGAATAVWLATLPDDGPTGGFFRDQKAIPW